MNEETSRLDQIAVDIIAAYIANNRVPVSDLPKLIVSVKAKLAQLGNDQTQSIPASNLTVTESQIRKSITPDAIISFIDGRPYKTLRRHLTAHGFTPYTYCMRYGLPSDYPIVATSYSARRADISRSHSFGKHERE
jgi:predicted transcriptional regulator